jgi:hypothetical protein
MKNWRDKLSETKSLAEWSTLFVDVVKADITAKEVLVANLLEKFSSEEVRIKDDKYWLHNEIGMD